MKYWRIASVFTITIIVLSACQPYAVPVGVMGIVHSSNQRKIENLKSEIGNVIFFEIKARVRTQAGIQEKSELVTAKITGHKEFAGGVVRIFDTQYGNGGKLAFSNPHGKTLIIPSRPAEQLGSDYDGGLDHLIAGYIDGKLVQPKELRSHASMKKYGFILESYIAPIIN
jgi:hypothetical protein